MDGYHRFFIIGLLVIGLVGAHTENYEDHSAQQLKESLLTIENVEAQPAAEDAPRILKKRSNSNRYGGISKDEYDFTLNFYALRIFERETVVPAAQNTNDFRPLDLSMRNQANRQAAELDRMRQNAQRSQAARIHRQEEERLRRMEEARRRQQQQRYDLVRRRVVEISARVDAIHQRYQQRQQQQGKPNSREGPPRSSRGQMRGLRRQ